MAAVRGGEPELSLTRPECRASAPNGAWLVVASGECRGQPQAAEPVPVSGESLSGESPARLAWGESESR